MANGRVLINPPGFTPSSFGLLAVAQDLTGQVDPHWLAGVTFQPLCGAADVTFDQCMVVTGVGASPAPAAKEATADTFTRAATPFTVLARKDCSVPTWWTEASGQVTEILTEGEGYQVERAFWTGAAGGRANVVHPHLAANADLVIDGATFETETDVVDASPLGIVEALGRLEAELADCYQGVGVIHVPAVLGPLMVANLLMELRGGRYWTANGNQVALGRGYPGTGPDGSATTDVAWMYATGAVFYLRGPIQEISSANSVDRSINTLEQLAERTYLVSWDCCHLGVSVNTATT